MFRLNKRSHEYKNFPRPVAVLVLRFPSTFMRSTTCLCQSLPRPSTIRCQCQCLWKSLERRGSGNLWNVDGCLQDPSRSSHPQWHSQIFRFFAHLEVIKVPVPLPPKTIVKNKAMGRAGGSWLHLRFASPLQVIQLFDVVCTSSCQTIHEIHLMLPTDPSSSLQCNRSIQVIYRTRHVKVKHVYDCDAGFKNWKYGWSSAKQSLDHSEVVSCDHLGISINWGTVYNGKSIYKWMIWGYPCFRTPPLDLTIVVDVWWCTDPSKSRVK